MGETDDKPRDPVRRRSVAFWVGLGICALGLGVAVYGAVAWGGAGLLKGLRPGYFFTSCAAVVLLGALIALGVDDALLALTVLLDAALLVASVTPLAHARVRMALTWPLLLLVLVLIAVAFGPRLAAWRWRPLRFAGVAFQLLYVAGLALFVARARPGSHLVAALPWLLLLGTAAALTQVAAVLTPARAPWPRLVALPRWGIGAIVFVLALAGLIAAAGGRLRRPSPNNHYVYLADSYLHGRLELDKTQLARKRKRKQYDDWARVDRVKLARPIQTRRGTLVAGTVLRGQWLKKNRRRTDLFRTTRGRVLRLERGDWRPAGVDWYISFPPFPAVLMAPGVAIWGYRFNDVIFGVLLAALTPLLLLLFLERMRGEGLSKRSLADNLWLTLLFTFGTVNYFASVRGEVWFTAHIVGLVMLLAYLHACLGARFPVLAGLALGLATASRPPLLFAAAIFVYELWRRYAPAASDETPTVADRLRALPLRPLLDPVLRFGVPLAAVGILLMWHNAARFDSAFEFGHRYLDVLWQERMQKFGLFDIHYLSRNLSALITFLPHFQPEPPYFLISRHGLSLLLVTPVWFLLFFPRERGHWHRPLWISAGAMLALVLFYQNTGFVQFSYRFSLDFTPLLVILLAVGGRPLSRPVKVLILWGVLINAFGAFTFGMAPEFYGRTNWVWTPLDPGCAC